MCYTPYATIFAGPPDVVPTATVVLWATVAVTGCLEMRVGGSGGPLCMPVLPRLLHGFSLGLRSRFSGVVKVQRGYG